MSKVVYRYNPDTGEFVSGYKSVSRASRDLQCDETSIRKRIDTGKQAIGFLWSRYKFPNYLETDNEIIKESVRLARQTQRFRDKHRIQNKTNRDYNRIVNILEDQNEELIKLLKERSLDIVTTKYDHKKSAPVLVPQVADLHLNELVDVHTNKYDFEVAKQRMQKYAYKIKQHALQTGARKIVVAATGDFINSNRRLDEKMAMATSRAKASLLGAELMVHFITDLNEVCDVDVAFVTGNESRIEPEWGFEELVATDNYDYIIMNIARLLLRNKPGINFIDGHPLEVVIGVNGRNILLIHGNTINGAGKGATATQATIQQIIGKYAEKDVIIHYILFGHIHFAEITDLYCRSGSLIGYNAYSDNGINLITRPSQVLHEIEEDGSMNNTRIDLSSIQGFDGYNIEEDFEMYDVRRSREKRFDETIIKTIEV